MRGSPGSVITLTLEKLRKIMIISAGSKWQRWYPLASKVSCQQFLHCFAHTWACTRRACRFTLLAYTCFPKCFCGIHALVRKLLSLFIPSLRSVASCINKLAHTLIISYLAIDEADMSAEALIVLRQCLWHKRLGIQQNRLCSLSNLQLWFLNTEFIWWQSITVWTHTLYRKNRTSFSRRFLPNWPEAHATGYWKCKIYVCWSSRVHNYTFYCSSTCASSASTLYAAVLPGWGLSATGRDNGGSGSDIEGRGGALLERVPRKDITVQNLIEIGVTDPVEQAKLLYGPISVAGTQEQAPPFAHSKQHSVPGPKPAAFAPNRAEPTKASTPALANEDGTEIERAGGSDNDEAARMWVRAVCAIHPAMKSTKRMPRLRMCSRSGKSSRSSCTISIWRESDGWRGTTIHLSKPHQLWGVCKREQVKAWARDFESARAKEPGRKRGQDSESKRGDEVRKKEQVKRGETLICLFFFLLLPLCVFSCYGIGNCTNLRPFLHSCPSFSRFFFLFFQGLKILCDMNVVSLLDFTYIENSDLAQRGYFFCVLPPCFSCSPILSLSLHLILKVALYASCAGTCVWVYICTIYSNSLISPSSNLSLSHNIYPLDFDCQDEHYRPKKSFKGSSGVSRQFCVLYTIIAHPSMCDIYMYMCILLHTFLSV